MAQTKIEWADYTFNPWIGCTKVDDLCTNCYAESDDKRRKWTPEGWGKGKPRHRTTAGNWNLVRRLNNSAICLRCGEAELIGSDDCRHCGTNFSDENRRSIRVFSASLADWLDDEVPIEWLADFLSLVHECQNLTWMLLTKRPENFVKRVDKGVWNHFDHGYHKREDAPAILPWLSKWSSGDAPHNVWIGTSVGTQKSADLRIPQLLEIPAAIRFLSCEPLLGPVDLCRGCPGCPNDCGWTPGQNSYGIHWVIAGGESGSHARPMHPAWARSLSEQCAAAGVPFFFKQWGEFFPVDDTPHDFAFGDGQLMNRAGKHAAGRLLDGVEYSAFPVSGFLASKFNHPAPEALSL